MRFGALWALTLGLLPANAHSQPAVSKCEFEISAVDDAVLMRGRGFVDFQICSLDHTCEAAVRRGDAWLWSGERSDVRLAEGTKSGKAVTCLVAPPQKHAQVWTAWVPVFITGLTGIFSGLFISMYGVRAQKRSETETAVAIWVEDYLARIDLAETDASTDYYPGRMPANLAYRKSADGTLLREELVSLWREARRATDVATRHGHLETARRLLMEATGST